MKHWFALLAFVSLSASAANNSRDYFGLPAILSGAGTPIVMLAMSNDHQLFYKAYTDWDDLDGDSQGRPENTYAHSVDYYGYFDHAKCYRYDSTEHLFRPVSLTSDKYCRGTGEGQWSGNFLNWASTARIDAVRKILYGGTRVAKNPDGKWVAEHQWDSTQDGALPNQTVLERTYLPNDAHSFAKYYPGNLVDGVNDIEWLTPHAALVTSELRDRGITICNTTRPTGNSGSNRYVSNNVTAPPTIRAVRGNYTLWAANERWQCTFSEEKSASNGNDPAETLINAYNRSPSRNRMLPIGSDDGQNANNGYVARIQVCVAGLLGNENCKKYPDGNLKPVGLLQQYGDDDRVWFGLMTGSSRANKSGGVLRKNPGTFSDEVAVGSDGRFLSAPTAGNIVAQIDALRPIGYDHTNGIYNSKDNCNWGKTSFNDDQCRSWGNPLSEILLECYRYMAGLSPTAAFAANDSSLPHTNSDSLLRGMVSATWDDPLESSNSCASLNVIAFNASTSSYDTDQLAGATDLNTSRTADQMTDIVGAGEGIHGNTYFVGNNGTDDNELCTPKVVNRLSQVKGTCPDAPRLEGGYHIAGLAHHAATTDLRPPVNGVDSFPSEQTIKTYGVALTPTLPNVTIPVPNAQNGEVVKLLPACRDDRSGGNCGLVDFKVTQLHTVDANGIGRGAFYINWEDSEQGGDYDQDAAGVVSYEVTSTHITVTTDAIAQSSGGRMSIGFVIAGTTDDGYHADSGINGHNWTSSGASPGCNNCRENDPPVSHRFTLGTGGAQLLEQPLYYAAKWGGFDDSDGDGTPNLTQEWDRRDNLTGAFTSDGIPDSFFLAINPAQLNTQLGLVLEDIINRTSAGTGGSVVSQSVTGLGAVYQALYQPAFKSGNDSLSWVGMVHAMFIDDNGRLREDGNGNGKLDDIATDPPVTVDYDPLSDQTLVTRYESPDGGTTLEPLDAKAPLTELRSVWNARDTLARVANPVTQRVYTAAANARHIVTASPGSDGRIRSSDLVDFSDDQFDSDSQLSAALNLNSLLNQQQLIEWVRGKEVTGFRSRTAEFLADNPGKEVWRLGDVIHSTPTSVGPPNGDYDVMLGDDTYQAFKAQYKNRRTVVYAGANDGMLHAFNGGFWSDEEQAFQLKPESSTLAERPLGAELWAYVPFNLMPHLKWLIEQEYPHVYYVDGNPMSFDARIFDETDADHPGGWGTVLAVPFKFGGGAYWVDLDSDSTNGPSGDGAETRLRSTIVLFDITNPEQPPQLMAELLDSEFSDFFYTTASPTVVKAMQKSTTNGWQQPALNEWKLVFGVGPDSQASATRDGDAQVYSLDLKTLTVDGGGPLTLTSATQSFVGNPEVADWDADGIDDVVYVGTVGGNAAAPTGSIRRLAYDWSSSSISQSTLLAEQTGQAFFAKPTAVKSMVGQPWVMAGSGRLFTTLDNQSTPRQAFYGIKDSAGATTARSNFIDVSDVDIDNSGAVTLTGYEINGVEVTTLDQISVAVESADGWKRGLEKVGSKPSGRVIGPSATIKDKILFTEYVPDGSICNPSGDSVLWGLDLTNGVRSLSSGLMVMVDDAPQIVANVRITAGLAFSPVVHASTGRQGHYQAVIANDKGGFTQQVIHMPSGTGGRTSWRQIFR